MHAVVVSGEVPLCIYLRNLKLSILKSVQVNGRNILQKIAETYWIRNKNKLAVSAWCLSQHKIKKKKISEMINWN